MLDSGVPHVYLPGFHVGAQLRLSLEEVERHVRGRGAIGDYLHHLYTHNPLWDLFGIDSFYAHSWVIWDLINIAWLIEPAWVPSELVRSPLLTPDRRWQRGRRSAAPDARGLRGAARCDLPRPVREAAAQSSPNAASSADSSAQTASTIGADR